MTTLHKKLLELSISALSAAGTKLENHIEQYEKKDMEMDAMASLRLQYEVGNYSNLSQTVTNMEKTMKDAIAATARNTN